MYSPSCFTCPLKDCIANDAYRYNVLDAEKRTLAQLGGDAV